MKILLLYYEDFKDVYEQLLRICPVSNPDTEIDGILNAQLRSNVTAEDGSQHTVMSYGREKTQQATSAIENRVRDELKPLEAVDKLESDQTCFYTYGRTKPL
ncbi:MAG: hypothetical protein LBR09_02705 [Endomicrobium sp.]|nr:hypothetical protein [Endomicrobium sp.]